MRPYMESHGGDVELLRLEDGVAQLRLVGSCHGCAASAATLEQAIEQALEEAAPDLLGLEVEGVVAPPRTPAASVSPAAQDRRDAGLAAAAPRPSISSAACCVAASGTGLVVANVAGDVLAYRDRCAACGALAQRRRRWRGRSPARRCALRVRPAARGPLLDDEELQLAAGAAAAGRRARTGAAVDG